MDFTGAIIIRRFVATCWRTHTRLCHGVFSASSSSAVGLNASLKRQNTLMFQKKKYELLTEMELEHLNCWREKESLLLAEVALLDNLVAVLRDI